MSNPNSLPNSEKIRINPCQNPEKKPASSLSCPEGAQDVTETKRITMRDDSKSCRFFMDCNLVFYLFVITYLIINFKLTHKDILS